MSSINLNLERVKYFYNKIFLVEVPEPPGWVGLKAKPVQVRRCPATVIHFVESQVDRLNQFITNSW